MFMLLHSAASVGDPGLVSPLKIALK